MPESGVEKISHENILSYEEILRVANLRKNLPDLIKNLKKINGIEIVSLTTNGVLLEKFTENLISAGIDGINLSLDTLNEEIFNKLT